MYETEDEEPNLGSKSKDQTRRRRKKQEAKKPRSHEAKKPRSHEATKPKIKHCRDNYSKSKPGSISSPPVQRQQLSPSLVLLAQVLGDTPADLRKRASHNAAEVALQRR